MSADRWGAVTRTIASSLLEDPDLHVGVDVRDLAPGPAATLVALIKQRRVGGLAAGWAALGELDEAKRIGGPGFIGDVYAVGGDLAGFDGLVAEARDLAARDRLRRGLERGADLQELRAIVERADAGPPGDFRRLDLEAFLREPLPEPDWLLEGLIERGELLWIVGRGKVGKSILALYLACAALSRQPLFLGAALAPVDWVVYVDAENSPRTVRRRVHLAGLSAELAAAIDYRSVRNVDLGAAGPRDELRRLLDRPGRGLVVLDSLIGLHTADEDSAGEVRRFVTGLRAVSEETGVTAIGLAHENRSGSLRGSLDWINASDGALELEKDAQGWRTLKVGERRDGPDDVPPRVFRFVPRDGRLLLEVSGEGLRRAGGRPPTAREIIARQILELRREEPTITRAETARRLATTRDHGTFRDAWLEADSQLGAESARAEGPGCPGGQGHPPIGGARPATTAPGGAS